MHHKHLFIHIRKETHTCTALIFFCSPHPCLAGVILYSYCPTSPPSLGSTHTHTHPPHICLTGSITDCVAIHHAAHRSGRRLITANFALLVCVCVCDALVRSTYSASLLPSYIPCSLKHTVSACNKSFSSKLGWLVHLRGTTQHFLVLTSCICAQIEVRTRT